MIQKQGSGHLRMLLKKTYADAPSVQKEIDFVLAHEDVANVFGNLQEKGEIPACALPTMIQS